MSSDRYYRLIVYFFCSIALISFLFGLYFRTIHGDEVILAEQVFSFQNLGFVKAELFDGMGKGWEVRQYHFHKLFIYLGVLFSNVFDFNLWVLRGIPLLFFLGLIFMLFKYFRLKKVQNDMVFVAALGILLVNFTVFEYSFLFRPEVIIAALGLLSFLLLHQAIQKNNSWLCLGSGAIAGLAAFTHLNGISYIMAGGLMLLIFSKWKNAFAFGFSAGLVALLYFCDLNNLAELDAFWEQFRSDPNLGDDDFKFLHAVLKVFNEHMRFFWNLPTATFSLLYLFCLVGQFSYFKKEYPTLLWYHLILIGSLSAIAQSKTVKYGLVYYPFLILIISMAVNQFFTNKQPKPKPWLLAVLVIYFFTNFGFALSYMQKETTSDLIKKNETYVRHLPKVGSKVLTNESFYFDGYKNYTIHLLLAYELLHEIYLKTSPSKDSFYKFASKQKNDYILLRYTPSSSIFSILELGNLRKGATNFGYQVVFKNEEVVIMENISAF